MLETADARGLDHGPRRGGPTAATRTVETAALISINRIHRLPRRDMPETPYEKHGRIRVAKSGTHCRGLATPS